MNRTASQCKYRFAVISAQCSYFSACCGKVLADERSGENLDDKWQPRVPSRKDEALDSRTFPERPIGKKQAKAAAKGKKRASEDDDRALEPSYKQQEHDEKRMKLQERAFKLQEVNANTQRIKAEFEIMKEDADTMQGIRAEYLRGMQQDIVERWRKEWREREQEASTGVERDAVEETEGEGEGEEEQQQQ
ncbi:hypothetical protein BDB00DRAFT_789300 [Zychaea mexicana]|uniref:uncharacterized protein n=1 Tax=Zychaea mexicana TaxID=64656 RepID=UPI0022FE3769|nr:uncharacterized protein BDB00DRAFT_789300 [Zychaea mexicana]KAI9491826.1 hypothetical protein BDB00DRAFT_789300 [Zychaea mexicana]